MTHDPLDPGPLPESADEAESQIRAWDRARVTLYRSLPYCRTPQERWVLQEAYNVVGRIRPSFEGALREVDSDGSRGDFQG